jgi:hypothetical protein
MYEKHIVSTRNRHGCDGVSLKTWVVPHGTNYQQDVDSDRVSDKSLPLPRTALYHENTASRPDARSHIVALERSHEAKRFLAFFTRHPVIR